MSSCDEFFRREKTNGNDEGAKMIERHADDPALDALYILYFLNFRRLIYSACCDARRDARYAVGTN